MVDRTYDRFVSTTNRRQAGTPDTSRAVRPVLPPQHVVIDLGAVYGRQPLFRRPNILVLASLHGMVVGQLHAWVIAESGWFGRCTYRVKIAVAEYWQQDHLVPGWAIRPASFDEVNVSRMKGKLSE